MKAGNPIKQKPLVLRDEIHGDMSFDRVLRCVVDHDAFQRLRYIKQLGLAEYVFPCATHTRFQHSLGASYLASQYYRSMLQSWVGTPFKFASHSKGTEFLIEETLTSLVAVTADTASNEFWHQVVCLAGMLHDIGHGPWSHSFENLDLDQDFSGITSKLSGTIGHYFDEKTVNGGLLKHEDISVLYIFQILSDLEEQKLVKDARRFFLPVASLVNRKMAGGKFKAEIESEIEEDLRSRGLKGGTSLYRLLRPIISGPFDVDRIDYIQRDGRNCGVSLGGIEWRRIVSKLIPCLAKHPNDRGEPDDVVLISHMKNQHVLDDFIFSLFQMYAQVYMHPKIVGFEEEIRRLLAAKGSGASPFVLTFEQHKGLSDEGFRQILRKDFGIPEIDHTLMRKAGHRFKVASFSGGVEPAKELEASGFERLDTQDRPMLKDSVGVFLYNTALSDSFVLPWDQVSPIARQFHSINHSPDLWIRREP